MEFTLEAYEQLVNLIRKKGYQICDYHNYLQYDKFVIMRHDVDFDIRKAVKMAEVENKLGVRSIYFLLISSDFYNVLSPYNHRCIRRIIECGHEIGLHFDETKYLGQSMYQIKDAIYKEVKMMEEMLNIRVESVSMHRPSKEMLESDLDLDYVINTYGRVFFKDIKYLSDARMSWKEDVISIIEHEEFLKIQLLTHPFWYTRENMTITEKLKRFTLRAKEERYKELSSNLRDIRSILTEEDIWN